MSFAKKLPGGKACDLFEIPDEMSLVSVLEMVGKLGEIGQVACPHIVDHLPDAEDTGKALWGKAEMPPELPLQILAADGLCPAMLPHPYPAPLHTDGVDGPFDVQLAGFQPGGVFRKKIYQKKQCRPTGGLPPNLPQAQNLTGREEAAQFYILIQQFFLWNAHEHTG